jgi:hypothetical protein
MALDVGLWLAHCCDPVSFAVDRLRWRPDDWQAALLRSESRYICINASRQSGKSTTTAALALHTALYEAGSLILLVSPSLRQSRELFLKVTAFLRDLEPATEPLEEDNRLSCTLANQSRIVSLPGDGRTIRGYSAPRLILEDESAFVSDEVFTACQPMLAVSQGRYVLMSTPNLKQGHFYQAWDQGGGWEKIRILGRDCPRISAEFLAQQERELGLAKFRTEYCGEFLDDQEAAFGAQLVEACLVDGSDWEWPA